MTTLLKSDTSFVPWLLREEQAQYGSETKRAAEILDALLTEYVTSTEQPTRIAERVSHLSRFIRVAQQFSYACRTGADEFTLTGTLLRRRGNCLGLTTVYCALAERLHLPIAPLLSEHHAAICVQSDVGLRPFEVSQAEGFLHGKRVDLMYGAPDCWRVLSSRELIAVHLSNRAALFLAPMGAEREARAEIDRALELFPDYVGARLNRAVLSLRMGQEDAALDDLRRIGQALMGPFYRHMVLALMNHILKKQFDRRGASQSRRPVDTWTRFPGVPD